MSGHRHLVQVTRFKKGKQGSETDRAGEKINAGRASSKTIENGHAGRGRKAQTKKIPQAARCVR